MPKTYVTLRCLICTQPFNSYLEYTEIPGTIKSVTMLPGQSPDIYCVACKENIKKSAEPEHYEDLGDLS